MLNITRRDIEEAHGYARDAMRFAKTNQTAGESLVGTVKQTLEVAAGAAAVGVATGVWGPLHINGNPVPIDFAASMSMHLLAFFGVAGKYNEDLHNVADGVLAGYITKFGVGYGTKLRAGMKGKDGKPLPALNLTDISGDDGRGPPAQMYGGPGIRKAQPLTLHELASMAQAVR